MCNIKEEEVSFDGMGQHITLHADIIYLLLSTWQTSMWVWS